MEDYEMNIVKIDAKGMDESYIFDIPSDKKAGSFACYFLASKNARMYIAKVDNIIAFVKEGKLKPKKVDRSSEDYNNFVRLFINFMDSQKQKTYNIHALTAKGLTDITGIDMEKISSSTEQELEKKPSHNK